MLLFRIVQVQIRAVLKGVRCYALQVKKLLQTTDAVFATYLSGTPFLLWWYKALVRYQEPSTSRVVDLYSGKERAIPVTHSSSAITFIVVALTPSRTCSLFCLV